MGAYQDDRGLAAHVESVARRPRAETDRLIATMLQRWWPGGVGDRTDLVAIEWVRQWGPRRAGSMPPECRCVAGRCHVCN